VQQVLILLSVFLPTMRLRLLLLHQPWIHPSQWGQQR